jgi:hypothetical protein
MGLGSLKGKLARLFAKRWVVGWYRDGLEGKEGKGTMGALKKIQGLRTALMALVLLSEALAKASGHDFGPVFAFTHAIFAGFGWDEKEAGTLFDPAVLASSIFTLWAAALRVKSYVKEQKAKADAEAPAAA